jgi:purine-nucleoside phosphorylase
MPKDEFVPEDPMDLVGVVLPGEPGQLEAMAETFVEEYVRMGWDERRILTLFTNPLFLATHRIYRQKGDAYVRELIAQMRQKWAPVIGGPAR